MESVWYEVVGCLKEWEWVLGEKRNGEKEVVEGNEEKKEMKAPFARWRLAPSPPNSRRHSLFAQKSRIHIESEALTRIPNV